MLRQISVLVLLAALAPAVAWAEVKKIDASQLYMDNCAVCHGDTGNGKSRASGGLMPAPRDFTTPQAAMELSRDRMLQSVRKGRAGTAMIGWVGKLSDREIEAVVDYVRAEFLHPEKVAISPEMAKRLKRGEHIYSENCSVCHGDYGQTGVWTRNSMSTAPRNFTSERSRVELSRSRMIDSVTFGVPGKAMMPYGSKLPAADIAAAVDYVRVILIGLPAEDVEKEAKAAQGAEQPVANLKEYMARPFPNKLAGDPERGRRFYVRNCFSCHGVKGDGQGPRAFFINPKPRNFVDEDSRRALNKPRIFNSVTNGIQGSVMPAWGKVLSAQEVADVAEFVFRAFIQGNLRGVSEQDVGAGKQKKN